MIKKMIIKFGIIIGFLLIITCLSSNTIDAANITINNSTAGGIAQGIADAGPNGNLTLENGIYAGEGNYNITINFDITISGSDANNTVINAQNLSRIFYVNTNSTLDLYNITLTNGNALTSLNNTYGGAIYVAGYLNTQNVIFANNIATRGGATYRVFLDNTAVSTIVNDTFINNIATDSSAGGGGAIMFSGGTLNIYNSQFVNNTAANNGGAIDKTNGSQLLVVNTNFYYNVAHNNGGAIYNTNSNMTIINSTFNNNKANITSTSNGGAVYSNTATSTIILNSNFTNNTANSQGGAVYVRHSLNITGSNFISNIANQGGGIYSNPDTGDIFVNYNRFVNNNNYDYYLNNTSMSKIPNLNYNWWGDNTPLVYGFVLTNWFVMQLTANNLSSIINSSITQPGSSVNLSYQLILYNNTINTFNVVDYGNLPDFMANLTWIGSNGIISELVNAKGFYSQIINFTSGSGFSLRAIGDNEDLNLYQEIVYVNLTISKTANVNSALNGQGVSYNVTVTNNGNNMANNVLVNDILPYGLIYQGSSGAGDYDPVAGVWHIGNLANGDNVTLIITSFLNRSGNITNFATLNLDEFNLGINDTNVTINVNPVVNVTIMKVANVTTAFNGDNISYTIVVTNYGPDNATNVIINEILPNSLIYISSNGTQGVYNPVSGVWNIGNLDNGSSASLVITVRVNGTGVIINSVNVTANQTNINNETNGSNITTNITVKISSNSTVIVPNSKVGQNTTITGIATDENGNPLSGITLSVSVDGTVYNVTTNTNGVWSLNYTPLVADNLSVLVSWTSNSTHNGFSNSTVFSVVKEDKPVNSKRDVVVTIRVVKNPDGSVTIIANATYTDDGSPASGYPVNFFLDGKKVGSGITNKRGIATLTIPASKLGDGPHRITVTLEGGNTANDAKVSTKFTISSEGNGTNGTNDNPVAGKAAMRETGMPIIAIVLVLLSILGFITQKRRK